MSAHAPYTRRSRVACIVLLLGVLWLPACDDELQLQRALNGLAATSGTILSALSGASTASGVMGILTPGPQRQGMDPNLTLTLTPSAVAVTNGGTATLAVSSASAFTELTVAVEGLDGHYQFPFPMATTSATLQLTIDQDIMTPTVVFSVVASDGTNLGPAATEDFVIVFVGTGDIQVSLTFDQQDDVDLYVVDPSGDTVFFGMRTVASGGTLDLDANPACGSPSGNAENITWPEGSAPLGTYGVLLDLFASCFPNPVNWLITISVKGQAPQILTGTLVPGDAAIGPQPIASFTVSAPMP